MPMMRLINAVFWPQCHPFSNKFTTICLSSPPTSTRMRPPALTWWPNPLLGLPNTALLTSMMTVPRLDYPNSATNGTHRTTPYPTMAICERGPASSLFNIYRHVERRGELSRKYSLSCSPKAMLVVCMSCEARDCVMSACLKTLCLSACSLQIIFY